MEEKTYNQRDSTNETYINKIVNFLRPFLFVFAMLFTIVFISDIGEACDCCKGAKCRTCNGRGYTASNYYNNSTYYTKFKGCTDCGCPGSGSKQLSGTSSYPTYAGNEMLISMSVTRGCGHPYSCLWGSYSTTKYATCTETGTETKYCTRSGCSYSSSRATPALGHSTPSSWSGSDGSIHYKNCERCGTRLVNESHTTGDWSYADGGNTRYHYCTTCGKNLEDYDYWVTVHNGVNSTNNIGSQWVDRYTPFTVRTTANTGYHFGTSNSDTYRDSTITVTGPYQSITGPSALPNNYKITLNANGGSFSGAATKTVATRYNTADSHNGVPVPSRTGYTFLGYFDGSGRIAYDANGNGVNNNVCWNGYSNYICLSDVILYAHWKENIYQLKYSTNYPTHQYAGWNKGNGYSPETSYTYTQNVTLNNRYSYDTHGFKVKDWTISGGNYNGQVKNLNEVINKMHNNQNGKVTVTANWVKKQFTLTFDTNGGELISGSVDPQTIDFEKPYNLSAKCKKDGLIFVGWSTEKDNISKVVASAYAGWCVRYMNTPTTNTISGFDGNITLYATYAEPVSDLKDAYVTIDLDKDGKADSMIPMSKSRNAVNGFWNILSSDYLAPYTSEIAANNIGIGVSLIDNAGNSNNIPITPDPPIEPIKEYSVQTKYWKLNSTETKQTFYTNYPATSVDTSGLTSSTTACIKVQEGQTWAPSFSHIGELNPPAGYHEDRIDEGRVINEDTTFNAYYKPNQYTIHYVTKDDETCDQDTSDVFFDELVGVMPTPSKEGHNFDGWFVEVDGEVTDIQITPETIYTYPNDINVVAKFTPKQYTIYYDAQSHNGTCGTNKLSVTYGQNVDLSIIASKDGWTHIGWNRDETATVGEDVFTMPAKDITVYAVFKRTVTGTFNYYEYNETTREYDTKTENVSVTYYNQSKEGVITTPDIPVTKDWQPLGWTTGTEYNSPVVASQNDKVTIDRDTTFYAQYNKFVELSFITNIDIELDSMSGYAYLNAAGDELKYKVTLPDALTYPQKSFVSWVQTSPDSYCEKCGSLTNDDVVSTSVEGDNGCRHCFCYYPNKGLADARDGNCTCCNQASSEYEFDEDIVLSARWDAFPVITSEGDTYVSYDDIDNIESILINKTQTSDNEDGTTTVIVENIDEIKSTMESSTNNFDMSILYSTKDDYGNITYLRNKVHVVNTEAKEIAEDAYVRFMSSTYSPIEVTFEDGGLEDTSLWRTEEDYANALAQALIDADKVKNTKITTANQYLFEDGSSKTVKYVYNFSQSDIKEMKNFLISKDNAGEITDTAFGKYESSESENPLQEFIRRFL